MPVFHMNQILEAILEMMDEGIHVIDMEGKTIFYNLIAASHDGMNVSEVLGVPLLQAFPNLTEQSSTLLRVIQTGKPIYHQEQSYMNLHGNKIETLNTTLPVYVDDQLIGAVEISKIKNNPTTHKMLLPLREAIKETESKLINEALLQTKGNILQASKLLKIPRQTLQYKIQKLK